MIRVIGATPRNATSALIPITRKDFDRIDKRTTLYFMTDVCVVLAPCWCGADYNEPCIGTSGKMTTITHVDRRMAARRTRATLGLDEQLRVAYLLQPSRASKGDRDWSPHTIPKFTIRHAGGYDPRKPRKRHKTKKRR